MIDLKHHQSLFDEFEKEIDEANQEMTNQGCTCGYNTAEMVNAGTIYVEFRTQEGYFDEECPVHREESHLVEGIIQWFDMNTEIDPTYTGRYIVESVEHGWLYATYQDHYFYRDTASETWIDDGRRWGIIKLENK